ncbi:hypothetical protein Q5424_21290, partial [Conexibacter sp. JD483]|uniref:hypothetical protein n=2 Tax=Conexibacter TaxID=191494 RepID=UPI002870034E
MPALRAAAVIPSSATAGPVATAAVAKPVAAKQRCPQGTIPLTRARGRRLVAVRDRRGRLRCRAAQPGRPPAPGAT